MKCPAVIVALMFIMLSPLCEAQTEHDNLFSLDLSYALTGLLNQGGGIGLSFEKKLMDWLSFTGIFGHMTFLTSIENVYCTSVSISLFSNYYPLSNGLDKLYLSAGGGCDFMNYFGRGNLPENEDDTIIFITPQAGWKFNVSKYLMIDASAGYKFIIDNTENYEKIKDYVNPGMRINLGIKIFLSEIVNSYRERRVNNT